MQFLGAKVGRGVVVGGLVFCALLALGCAGKSESHGGDGNGDGGTSGAGGTNGLGGTSGASGTVSTGGTSGASGASSTGGTGSGSMTCISVCEHVQMCPSTTPIDCVAECDRLAGEGCPVELGRYLDCLAPLEACAIDSGSCEAEFDAYAQCLDGGGGMAGCNDLNPPATGDCISLCQMQLGCVVNTSPAICPQECADQRANAMTMGCAVEYDRVLGCASTCTNLCEFGEGDCELTLLDYYGCQTTYCTLNPTAEPCAGI